MQVFKAKSSPVFSVDSELLSLVRDFHLAALPAQKEVVGYRIKSGLFHHQVTQNLRDNLVNLGAASPQEGFLLATACGVETAAAQFLLGDLFANDQNWIERAKPLLGGVFKSLASDNAPQLAHCRFEMSKGGTIRLFAKEETYPGLLGERAKAPFVMATGL